MPSFRALSFLTGVLCCAACKSTSGFESRDVPVPANEPRAELSAVVSLRSRPGCDEAFSLGLYEDAGIEWIAWGEGPRPCTDRVVVVRYLPRRISRDEVIGRIGKLADHVEVKSR